MTILSGPTFTKAAKAPLAGTLRLTTDVDSRVGVVVSDGTNTWQRNFYDFTTNHSIILAGFRANTTNKILVTVYDKYRNACTAAQPLEFVTAPLPSDFPKAEVIKREPAKMEPGYTLFIIVNRNAVASYVDIVDNSGKVVWYTVSPTIADVRQLPDGNIFLFTTNQFREINLLGETVRTWNTPSGYDINVHDAFPTDHGTFLYLSDASRTLTDFPTSDTNPNAPLVTTNVLYNRVVEISQTNSALLNVWSPIDFLDPRRVTYLTFDINSPKGLDIEHANALLEDPRDHSIIVSMREQNAVFKFSRDGQLKWILGPHANWSSAFQNYLLAPAATPFEWNYGQHAPMLTPRGTLLLYDDGNNRASPYDQPPVPDQDNYSEAVEYSINETNMTVSQVWDSGVSNDDRLFTPIVGDADWLPQRRNVLVTYGYVTYINGVHPSPYSAQATMVRIKEFTHDPVPEVVFDLSYFDHSDTNANYKGYFCYRSDRIPDLYAHPAKPVTDLFIADQNATPRLEFSADPSRTYVIQASTDLKQWQTIGTASAGGGAGDFEFDDLNSSSYKCRYYRIVTE